MPHKMTHFPTERVYYESRANIRFSFIKISLTGVDLIETLWWQPHLYGKDSRELFSTKSKRKQFVSER